MSRFVSPVNPSVFPHLTTLLLGIGIFYTAWFFVYEVGAFVTLSLFYQTGLLFLSVSDKVLRGARQICMNYNVTWHSFFIIYSVPTSGMDEFPRSEPVTLTV